MKKKTISLLLPVFLLLLPACGKEKVRVNQETLEYFQFNDGAQWIYAFDSLGFMDTITQLSFTRSLMDDPIDDVKVEYEEIVINRSSSLYGSSDSYVLAATESGDLVHKTWPGETVVGVTPVFSTRPATVTFFLVDEDPVTLRGRYYGTVRHFRYIEDPDTFDYWFAWNTGMIRMEKLHSDTVMELVEMIR